MKNRKLQESELRETEEKLERSDLVSVSTQRRGTGTVTVTTAERSEDGNLRERDRGRRRHDDEGPVLTPSETGSVSARRTEDSPAGRATNRTPPGT